MANRRFEMYEIRQVLVRMRQGDSDRAIARDGLMGRDKARQVRALAAAEGWLERDHAFPDDGVLAAVFGGSQRASTPSLVEPYREQVTAWYEQGVDGTTIHRILCRRHGFTGSYSSVRRFVEKLAPLRDGVGAPS